MLGELLLVGLAAGELEVQDVALVQLDLLVVADVNLLGALGDEAHVVTDHEDSSLELLEAALRNGTVASKWEKQIRINQVRERMFLQYMTPLAAKHNRTTRLDSPPGHRYSPCREDLWARREGACAASRGQ